MTPPNEPEETGNSAPGPEMEPNGDPNAETPATADQDDPQHVGEPSMDELIGYGVGGLGSELINQFSDKMPNSIMHMVLQVNPLALGIVDSLKSILDAFTDPVMGYISDNTRSRFGRRKPYILIGGILLILSFIGLWTLPAGLSEKAYINRYMVMMLFFTLASTVIGIPYAALGLELSPSYDGKTRVFTFKAFFSKINIFINPWFFPIILGISGVVMTESGGFPEMTVEVQQKILRATAIVVIAVSLVALGSILWVLFRSKERGNAPAKRESIWTSVKSCFMNVHFLRIGAMYVILLGVMKVFMQFGLYLNNYYVFQGNLQMGATIAALANNLGTVVSLVCMPLAYWFTKRTEKHICLMVALGLMSFGSVIKWWAYTPEYPYLQFITAFFYAPGITVVFMILPAMMADAVDFDEWKNGGRREGLYGAAMGWIIKSSGTLTGIIAGWLLLWVGVNTLSPENQSPETIFKLRLSFSILPAIGIASAGLLLIKYPLTRSYMTQLHQEIAERKAQNPDAT